MRALLLCLGLCFIITSASVSLTNDAPTMAKAPIIKASPAILTKASGFPAATAQNSSYVSDLKGISNPTYNISGKWDMIGNSIFQFVLDLTQTNNVIRGTMTRTNGNEPVDSIEGTINQGGRVEFNRVRPNEWSQKYTGLVSRSSDGIYTMKGTFTQTGAQGDYSWNATLIQAQTKNSVRPSTIKTPSIVSQGETGKVELPIAGKRILPMLNQTPNKEPSTTVQKHNPVIQGSARSVVNLKHLDWRNFQLIAMSKLGVNTTANLDFADSTSSFIDSSGNDLTARFKWLPTTMIPPASAVWQVSIMPFPYDPKNWANPPGLLAQGILGSNENEFAIDFGKFIPTQKEIANRWSLSKPYLIFQKSILASFKNVAALNLEHTDTSNVQAVQANKNFISWADDAVKQIDSRPAMMVSTSNKAAITKNISGLMASRRILNPILTTKSISPQFKISQQRSVNATVTKNIAGIIGSQGTIINKGLVATGVSQSIPAILSEDALINALPQERRTYYVRVVPLDSNGNCTGLPSDEKEVIVGKPIVELAKWAFLQSALFGSNIKLAVADGSVRPYRMGGEFPCSNNWYLESDAYVDWSQDLNRWCIWSSNLTNLTSAEWQISQVPFNNEELMNPQGLVARGKLNVDQSDMKSVGCAGEIAGLSSDKYASGHEFSIDFSKFAPPRDPNKPLQIKYYLRVVALIPSGPGTFIGYSSPTRIINYGQQTQPKIALPVPVTVFQPDVKILSYSPIQNADPEAEYHFIATSDNPPQDIKMGSQIFFPEGSLWKKGDHLYTKPKDESWWDEVVDFFESILDFFASIVNWVSTAWDDIKSVCVDVISNAICLGNTDCSSAVGPWVSTGIDTGLASMGIPPSIPNFDQLASMGSDYLTKTLLAQAGVDPGMADLANQIDPDTVKQGVNAFIDYSGSGGPNGLKPDPAYQYHPAYMIVEVTNSQGEPTLPGTLEISEPNHVFVQKSVAIPSLQPGETLRIPIVFEQVPDTFFAANDQFYEACYYDENGNPARGPETNWSICATDWAKIYQEPETLGAAVYCDPSVIDTMPIEEQFKETLAGTPQEGSPLYVKYIYTGTGDSVQIAPNQPWSV